MVLGGMIDTHEFGYLTEDWIKRFSNNQDDGWIDEENEPHPMPNRKWIRVEVETDDNGTIIAVR